MGCSPRGTVSVSRRRVVSGVTVKAEVVFPNRWGFARAGWPIRSRSANPQSWKRTAVQPCAPRGLGLIPGSKQSVEGVYPDCLCLAEANSRQRFGEPASDGCSVYSFHVRENVSV
jgi:hypothetical protein